MWKSSANSTAIFVGANFQLSGLCRGIEENACAECGTTFSRKDIYVHHMREKHFGAKANFEYVEDLTRLTSINCDI